MTPFLKWAGGKRWLVNNYSNLFPRKFNRYIEPFLGSGSVFFSLEPKKALLGDVNSDLIAAYNVIKTHWKQLELNLRKHKAEHNRTYYYKLRASKLSCPIQRAARFIYLNRTCFNGIYRVNRRGMFNVPIGTRDSVIFESDNFQTAAQLLGAADLRVSDFETLINEAYANDFVFADPPYTVRHNNNGFIKYNETLFSWKDQIRLAKALIRADRRGVIVVATNANNRHVRDLYRKRGLTIKTVSRFSPISGEPDSRQQFSEIVILSSKR